MATARPALARPAAHGTPGLAGLFRGWTPRLFLAGGRPPAAGAQPSRRLAAVAARIARRTARRRTRQGGARHRRLDRARPAADRPVSVVAEAQLAGAAEIPCRPADPTLAQLAPQQRGGAVAAGAADRVDRCRHGLFAGFPHRVE